MVKGSDRSRVNFNITSAQINGDLELLATCVWNQTASTNIAPVVPAAAAPSLPAAVAAVPSVFPNQAELEHELASALQRLAVSQNEQTALSLTVGSLASEAQVAKDTCARLERQLAEATARDEAMSAHLAAMAAQLAAAQAIRDELQAQVGSLTQKLTDALNARDALQSEVDSLKQQLIDAQVRVDTMLM